MTTTLGYLLGRVCSQKSNLLTNADWQKFQTAKGLTDWLPRLHNTPYAAASEQAETYEQFEKCLHQELADLRRDLFEGDDVVAEIFWRKYDWHNLKILLKEKLTGQELEYYLLPLGKNTLTDFDQQLLEKALEVYAQTQDFCRLDYFLDQEYFTWLKKKSSKLGAEVKAYVRAQIDAANFKLWYSGAHEEYSYFAGGQVPLNFFTEDTPEKILPKCFPNIELPKEINEGIIEKVLDDYAVKLLFRKYYSYNLTTIFCFLQAKENEIKNLKTMYLRQSRELPVLQNYLRYTHG